MTHERQKANVVKSFARVSDAKRLQRILHVRQTPIVSKPVAWASEFNHL